MIEVIKKALGHTPLYGPVRNWWIRAQGKNEIKKWEDAGRPDPPPHGIKQQMILQVAEQHRLKVFVETGTYYGDMVEAVRGTFDQVYSIELSKELFNTDKKRFKNAHNVHLIHGDSGRELGILLPRILQPALIWLDSHYSWGVTAKGEKDTPIFEELDHVLSTMNIGHVVMIDDARWFGVIPSYPTKTELEEFIRTRNRNVEIFVKQDSIIIVPTRDSSRT